LAPVVVQVAAHGGGCAVEQVRDLRDRPAVLAVMLGEQDVAAAYESSVVRHSITGGGFGRWVGHRELLPLVSAVACRDGGRFTRCYRGCPPVRRGAAGLRRRRP
jgi:hypothetical protein